MHKKSLLIAAGSLLLATSHAPALQVEGETLHRMQFRGEVQSVEEGFVRIKQPDSYEAIGIPISDIMKIRPIEKSDMENLVPALFQNPELLPLWDNSIYTMMLSYLEQCASDGNWQDCFHGTSKLEQVISSNPLSAQLQLLKAWSLYHLGLIKQSFSLLDSMDWSEDPSEVSTRYCWLQAMRAKHSNDTEIATYWGLLPMLRIPSDQSDLALQLYAECESWRADK